MKWVELILKFLKEVLPTLVSFMVGRKSKELENVKDENETLKKFQKIDAEDVDKDEAYSAEDWK